jgi:predicted Zn finger-like uncharacterized protein
MIIACPHCQAKLNLPENVEGKQVRCPNCRQVFRADKEVLQESVQAGMPEPAPAPTAVTPKPRDNQEERSRPKRYADYDEDRDYRRADIYEDDHFDRREVKKDVEEIAENARAIARPAGYVMLGAFAFTAINIAGNGVLTMLTEMEMGAMPGEVLALGLICSVGFYSLPLVFMMLGGRGLLTLGSRGMIVTAIVMNFILFFLLGGGAALNLGVLAMGELPVPLSLVVPTVVMNSISSVLNLAAAVMAIRVLRDPDVSEAYAVRLQELWRRRHY